MPTVVTEQGATEVPTTETAKTPPVPVAIATAFDAVPLTDLPSTDRGVGNAKTLTDDERKLAESIGSIITAGNAARAGTTYPDRDTADKAARATLRLVNRAGVTLPDGQIVRQRTIKIDDTSYGYAILAGPKPAPRKPKTEAAPVPSAG